MTPFKPAHRTTRDYLSSSRNQTYPAGTPVVRASWSGRPGDPWICFASDGAILLVEPKHLEPIAPAAAGGGGE